MEIGGTGKAGPVTIVPRHSRKHTRPFAPEFGERVPDTPPPIEHTGRHLDRLHLGRPEQCLRGSDVFAEIEHSPATPCHRTPGLPFATSPHPSCAGAGWSEAATHRPKASMQEGRLPHRRSDAARTNPRPKSILRARIWDSSPAACHPARKIQGPVPQFRPREADSAWARGVTFTSRSTANAPGNVSTFRLPASRGCRLS